MPLGTRLLGEEGGLDIAFALLGFFRPIPLAELIMALAAESCILDISASGDEDLDHEDIENMGDLGLPSLIAGMSDCISLDLEGGDSGVVDDCGSDADVEEFSCASADGDNETACECEDEASCASEVDSAADEIE